MGFERFPPCPFSLRFGKTVGVGDHLGGGGNGVLDHNLVHL